MAVVLRHGHGAPAWLTRLCVDGPAARAFYATCFGWSFERRPDTEAGGYESGQLHGVDIAGFVEPPHSHRRSVWLTHFASDDIDETCRRIATAGGRTTLGPVRIADQARYAYARDQAGVEFAVWQAVRHPGAGRMREPGALSWVELAVADLAAALDFYGTVFDHTFTDRSAEVGTEYRVVRAGDRPVAGIAVDADAAHGWLPYFAVSDVDLLLRLAVGSGGSVLSPVREVPGHGRIARLADPDGCPFAAVERCSGND